MTDLVVAYDRTDFPTAQAFVATLKQLGYSVHWDGGGDSDDNALAPIQASLAVIALWSPRSLASERVNFEAAAAAALGKLISVKIEGDVIPRLLAHGAAINLPRWDFRTISPDVEALFAALTRLTKKKPNRANWQRANGVARESNPAPTTAGAPAPRPKSTRRSLAIGSNKFVRWAAGGAAASVLAVGMFYLGSEAGRMFKLRAPATATTAAATFDTPRTATTPAAATTPGSVRLFAGEEHLATLAELERYSWQEMARRIGQRLGADGAAQLRTQANAGDPAAKLELCLAHLRGIDGFDSANAKPACLASAAQNHPAAQYLLWVARDRLDIAPEQARPHLIAAAAQGWAPAQQLLASYYRNAGEGFARDAAQARALLVPAAEKGYPRAMLDLSVVFLRSGSEAERNLAKAYLQRVVADREFAELCRPARSALVSLGEEPARCR
jgi:hypothetical protein